MPHTSPENTPDDTLDDALDAPLLHDERLHDNIWMQQGQVFLSGTQALVRLMLTQRQHDARQHLNTRGLISGYRGSSLGMVEQVIWQQGVKFKNAGIEFVPAINEALGAEQLLDSQRVAPNTTGKVDGVFALWCGKGAGGDRASEALKHGNAFGISPHGGVLVVAGEDRGCQSTAVHPPSDQVFQSSHMPVLAPADVSELMSFGLYGFALSRYSGAWVRMTTLSEVVDSSTTVDLAALHIQVSGWNKQQVIQTQAGQNAHGHHKRWPDLPSLRQASSQPDKLAAVAAFAQVNSIDFRVIDSLQDHIGIVTAGKAYHELMEVFRHLGLSEEALSAAGVSVLKLGLIYPIDRPRMQAFAQGLRQVLVIEENAPIVEQQMRDLFKDGTARPSIVGKYDALGLPMLSTLGDMQPSYLIVQVAHWLQQHTGSALGIAHLKLDDYLPAVCAARTGNAGRCVARLASSAGCRRWWSIRPNVGVFDRRPTNTWPL
jgi:indolepyruvate ferredoxin oxidoreductase